MQKISAIIFDLGGVLLDLDQDRTLRAFNRLGADLAEINMESSIFTQFETGHILPQDFRQALKSKLKGLATDSQIDDAWNKMLLTVAKERFLLVRQLKKYANIYLLSNTNSIHIDYFRQYLDETFGIEAWDELFDKQFLSYEMGMRKPHTEIYKYVAEQIGKHPEKCLFIDDNKANIKGAADAGMKTIHTYEPLDTKLFEKIKFAITEGKS